MRYYTFMQEFTWSRNFPGEDGANTYNVAVFDLEGFTLSKATKNVRSFLTSASKVCVRVRVRVEFFGVHYSQWRQNPQRDLDQLQYSQARARARTS